MSEPYDIISSYNDLCCIEMDFISLTRLITISLFAFAFSMHIIGADRPCTPISQFIIFVYFCTQC